MQIAQRRQISRICLVTTIPHQELELLFFCHWQCVKSGVTLQLDFLQKCSSRSTCEEAPCLRSLTGNTILSGELAWFAQKISFSGSKQIVLIMRIMLSQQFNFLQIISTCLVFKVTYPGAWVHSENAEKHGLEGDLTLQTSVPRMFFNRILGWETRFGDMIAATRTWQQPLLKPTSMEFLSRPSSSRALELDSRWLA